MAEQEVQEHATVLLCAIYLTCTCHAEHILSSALTPLQTSAENALELNGTDMEEGRRLSVYISNPERRKERTDSDANEREIYIAGLSKLVTKEDLETLFKTVRSVSSPL